jgi:hypothetical protein
MFDATLVLVVHMSPRDGTLFADMNRNGKDDYLFMGIKRKSGFPNASAQKTFTAYFGCDISPLLNPRKLEKQPFRRMFRKPNCLRRIEKPLMLFGNLNRHWLFREMKYTGPRKSRFRHPQRLRLKTGGIGHMRSCVRKILSL